MTDAGDSFLELTFDGGRFESHSVPVSVLAEFGTMQAILLRVARELWLRDHKERERVPRGFTEAAQLNLVASRESSYTAVLRRSEPAHGRDASSFDYVFEQALDVTVQALAAAANDNAQIPADFPRNLLDLLGNLGRHLGKGEELRIRGKTSETVARIDQNSRGRLALLTKRPLESDVDFEGEVESVDDSGKIRVRTRDGERIEVPFGLHRREELGLAFQQRPMVRVRVRGAMQLQQRRMTTVEELETVDDERAPDVKKLWDRLKTLEEVPDGWLDGDGKKPTEEVMAFARLVLSRLVVDHRSIPRPKVFPTPDGGLQAEWVLGSWAAEARFSPLSGYIVLEATNADTMEEREHLLAPGDISVDDATTLADWLSAMMPAEDARV
ncbi:hypothetical protein WMF31_22090 [Sorangium sp. So ce1036]|uniref:hypothetical protein n=1 Tax=Sorangium sp. So ce1036 TaxID=3133328 RepID=UPI003F065082